MKIAGISLRLGDSLRGPRPMAATRSLRLDDAQVAPPSGSAILDEDGNPILDEDGNEITEE